MSPKNHGVFQLLKEMTFRRILVFCSSWERWLSYARIGQTSWWDRSGYAHLRCWARPLSSTISYSVPAYSV